MSRPELDSLMNLRTAVAWVPVKVVGGVEDGDALDAESGSVVNEEIRQRFGPDAGDRIGHQRNVGVVGRKERRAGTGLIKQEHLVIAGDRHRHRGEHRSRIGSENVDLVLGDELIVERGRGGGAALIVIGNELEGNLFVECFHVGAAAGVHLIDPKLQTVVDGQGNAGIAAGGGIERSELDFRRCIGCLHAA